MGLFSKKARDPLEELAATLPRTKKVQFIEKPIMDVKASLDTSPDNITKLDAASYYANKNSYLQCAFYYKEDYSEIVMGIQLFANDKPKSDEFFWKVSKDTMKVALRKFGLNI